MRVANCIRTCGLAVFAAAVCIGSVHAADPTPPIAGASPAAPAGEPTPQSVALAKRYFEVINLNARMQKIIASLLPAFINDASQKLPDAASKREAIIAATEEAMAEWSPRYMDRMAVEYARTLTDDELAAAINFYDSPQGRSIVAKEGTMAPIATKIMVELQPELQQSMFDHLCRKIDCSKLNLPPKKG